MAFKLNHVHLKTTDPKKTAQFYVDTLGATMVGAISDRGYRVNLHGLTLNITTIIADQQRKQTYGMEHFALETDDVAGTLAQLTSHGARLLEEHATGDGRKVCFLEGPDGVQLEVLEMRR